MHRSIKPQRHLRFEDILRRDCNERTKYRYALDTCTFCEGKIRFTGEVVFYRCKVRSKATNVAEVNKEKVMGGIKVFIGSILKRESSLGIFVVLLLEKQIPRLV